MNSKLVYHWLLLEKFGILITIVCIILHKLFDWLGDLMYQGQGRLTKAFLAYRYISHLCFLSAFFLWDAGYDFIRNFPPQAEVENLSMEERRLDDQIRLSLVVQLYSIVLSDLWLYWCIDIIAEKCKKDWGTWVGTTTIRSKLFSPPLDL